MDIWQLPFHWMFHLRERSMLSYDKVNEEKSAIAPNSPDSYLLGLQFKINLKSKVNFFTFVVKKQGINRLSKVNYR